jgi:hypothetical protein
MDEGFELPVLYKGEEIFLPGKLHKFGYSYKIEVEIEGMPVFFEPDEERNWRVLAELEWHNRKTDQELLQAVILSLDKYTR